MNEISMGALSPSLFAQLILFGHLILLQTGKMDIHTRFC